MNEIQNPSHFELNLTIYIHYKWITEDVSGGTRPWALDTSAIKRERF